MKLRPPIKTHGGFYLSFVIENFPDNYQSLNYFEPFCAGASVFFNKEPSVEETLADIDSGTIAILKALRDEPNEFVSRLKRTRYTERAFKMAHNKDAKGFEDYIDHAVNEFILRKMSKNGMRKTFASQPNEANAWETIVKQLSQLSERLQGVAILCADFKKVLPIWDEENTLIYLDPPRLQSTHLDENSEICENELTVEDHIHLLALAKNARGKVIISGCPSTLYNRTLKGWKCKKKAKETRVECIWTNF